MKKRILGLTVGLLLVAASSAQASAITVNDPLWYEFAFSGSSGAAGACTALCEVSSAGNSQYAGDPAWTFALGAGGGTFTVTDAFLMSDRFEVFDFGASLGLTSVPGGGSCGNNPAVCFANPLSSQAVFALGAGAHSITINHVSGGTGAAFFRADAAGPAAVPEPATWTLLGLGLAALGARRIRKTGKRLI